MTYFKQIEEAKLSEERKEEEKKAATEEKKRMREEKQRKDAEEKQRKAEEKKKRAEESRKKKDEMRKRRGKGKEKGKAAKQLKFEDSSSEGEAMHLSDDSDVSVSDVCPGRVNVNECVECHSKYKEAKGWDVMLV